MNIRQYDLNLDLLNKLGMKQLLELNTAVGKELNNRLLKNDSASSPKPAPVIPVRKLDRKEIVEHARKSIERLKTNGYYRLGFRCCEALFFVNTEKRAVTVLLKGYRSHEIVAKATAKCNPTDCFNEDIGKAIALHRALKHEIPEIYINAPQPEGKEVGDIIMYGGKRLTLIDKNEKWTLGKTAHVESYAAKSSTVVDDTNRY